MIVANRLDSMLVADIHRASSIAISLKSLYLLRLAPRGRPAVALPQCLSYDVSATEKR